MNETDIIAIQQLLLEQVLAACERNPLTKRFISYNHHRMKKVATNIEEWLLHRKAPEQAHEPGITQFPPEQIAT